MASATASFETFPEKLGLRAWILREIRCNAPLYWLIGLFLLVTALFSIGLGDSLPSFLLVYLLRAARAVVTLCSFLVVIAGVRALAQKSDVSALRYLRRQLLSPANIRLLSRFTFGCLLLALFMGAFLYGKTAIPLLQPFSWDPLLAHIDAALFGGPAFRLLWPLGANPAVVYALDFLYGMWVPLVFIIWAGLLASERVPTKLRLQFWLSTMVCWIVVGLVLATVLSSVGPCFAPLLFPELSSGYAPLNAHLADINAGFPLSSSMSKDYLWAIYSAGLDEPGGISAMPSMHNAQTALFALAAFRLDRRFGIVMLAYAVLIYLGSIVLAWHYAIDGVAGIAVAILIWTACGRLADRMSRRAPA